MIGARSAPLSRVIPLRPAILVAAAVGTIVAGRALHSTIPVDVAHPLVIATHLYALLLVAGTVLLALAVGRAAVRALGVKFDSRLEAALFSVAVGFGMVAYAVLAVGLAGLLYPTVLGGLVLGIVWLVRRDLAEIVQELPATFRSGLALRRSLAQQDRLFALLLPVLEIFFVVLLIQALIPPVANDVLTYQVGAPKRFLELGRITAIWDIQQANMPATINMLYTLGMAFGSDELPSVLHLTLTAIVTVAIFTFGRRYFSARVGWMAAIISVSSLLVVVFGAVPNVEWGLTLFDFLAVYAFLQWHRSGQKNWLLLSGILIGLSLGSKYLGGITALALGLTLVVLAFKQRQTIGWTGIITLLIVYGVPAALIGSPWYLKNWLFLGNPLWPLLGYDPNDYNQYISPIVQYEGGLWGRLFSPFHLFDRGSVEYGGVRPPLALLVVPIYALLPKHRVVTGLLALALFHFVIWAQGCHVLRYITQALPEISIVAAYVIADLSAKHRPRVARYAATGLMTFGFVTTAVFTFVIVLGNQPFTQLLGLESRQEFLNRNLDNHRLVTHLNENRESVKGVLMVGDVRNFYLDTPKFADVAMLEFQTIVHAPDAATARAHLQGLGVSHVLVNATDLNWYTAWDPELRPQVWLQRFDETKSGYLVVEATWKGSTLYRVIDDTTAELSAGSQ